MRCRFNNPSNLFVSACWTCRFVGIFGFAFAFGFDFGLSLLVIVEAVPFPGYPLQG
jgi:hypothetical protein